MSYKSRVLTASMMLVLLSGCGVTNPNTAQRVVTDISKVYPVCVTPDSVRVIQSGNPIPSNYIIIGNLRVYNHGSTVQIPLESTLETAKKAASNAGGNTLFISKLESPARLSIQNYDLTGQILLDTGENPVDVVVPLTENLDVPIPRFGHESKPCHLWASIGYGRVVSGLEMSEDLQIVNGDIRNGLIWKVGLDYVFPGDGWGVGIYYSDFASSFDYMYRDNNIIFNFDSRLIGASVIYDYHAGRFLFTQRVGCGYTWIWEKVSSAENGLLESLSDFLPGLGIGFGTGISYSFTDAVFFGLNVNYDISLFNLYSSIDSNKIHTLSFAPVLKIFF